MKETKSNEAEVYAKVEPEKELRNGDDGGLSQHKDAESLGINDVDKEILHDDAVYETLDKDHVEGVRENSCLKPNDDDVGRVKETNGLAASTIVPVNELAKVERSPCPTTLLDPSMVEPSLSSDPSATQDLSLVSIPITQEQRSNSRVSVSPVLRTPARDGYNWRKYGQKQVKSPKGSRSYYRCTHSKCCAKKIECSNDSGNLLEIVNKGLHSHESPLKNYFSQREITPSVSADNIVAIYRKREYENRAVEEPEPKRRLEKDSSDSVSKPGKKHRFVVHAAGDVGISGDGYRWRKYGQKMVKGNPNPRNYYRCTSSGCPVRKHVETAVENTTAVIITYKEVHNHDIPVPKKRHCPPRF